MTGICGQAGTDRAEPNFCWKGWMTGICGQAGTDFLRE